MFVAVYQKALKLLYVEDLLKVVKRDFTPRFEQYGVHHTYDYDDTFRAHVKRLEQLAEAQKTTPMPPRVGQPAPQQRTVRGWCTLRCIIDVLRCFEHHDMMYITSRDTGGRRHQRQPRRRRRRR